jgi:hypothetical protein
MPFPSSDSIPKSNRFSTNFLALIGDEYVEFSLATCSVMGGARGDSNPAHSAEACAFVGSAHSLGNPGSVKNEKHRQRGN